MCALYIVSALLSNFIFSFLTISLTGGDVYDSPGTLLGMYFICGALSIFTAMITPFVESKFEGKYHEEVSIGNSALAFLVLYLPFLFATLLENFVNIHFLVVPIIIMLFLSYIPFYYTATKSFIALYEWLKEIFV